jgi:hypothetical protein
MECLSYESKRMQAHIAYKFFETFPTWNINKLTFRKYNTTFFRGGSISFWYEENIPLVVNFAFCMGYQVYWRREEEEKDKR